MVNSDDKQLEEPTPMEVETDPAISDDKKCITTVSSRLSSLNVSITTSPSKCPDNKNTVNAIDEYMNYSTSDSSDSEQHEYNETSVEKGNISKQLNADENITSESDQESSTKDLFLNDVKENLRGCSTEKEKDVFLPSRSVESSNNNSITSLEEQVTEQVTATEMPPQSTTGLKKIIVEITIDSDEEDDIEIVENFCSSYRSKGGKSANPLKIKNSKAKKLYLSRKLKNSLKNINSRDENCNTNGVKIDKIPPKETTSYLDEEPEYRAEGSNVNKQRFTVDQTNDIDDICSVLPSLSRWRVEELYEEYSALANGRYVTLSILIASAESDCTIVTSEAYGKLRSWTKKRKMIEEDDEYIPKRFADTDQVMVDVNEPHLTKKSDNFAQFEKLDVIPDHSNNSQEFQQLHDEGNNEFERPKNDSDNNHLYPPFDETEKPISPGYAFQNYDEATADVQDEALEGIDSPADGAEKQVFVDGFVQNDPAVAENPFYQIDDPAIFQDGNARQHANMYALDPASRVWVDEKVELACAILGDKVPAVEVRTKVRECFSEFDFNEMMNKFLNGTYHTQLTVEDEIDGNNQAGPSEKEDDAGFADDNDNDDGNSQGSPVFEAVDVMDFQPFANYQNAPDEGNDLQGEAAPSEDYSSILCEMFPDADPDFMNLEGEKAKGNAFLFEEMVEKFTLTSEYPKMDQYIARKRKQEEKERFLSALTAQDYLELIDEPEKIFSDTTKPVSELYKKNVQKFVGKEFKYLSTLVILRMCEEKNYHLYPIFKGLEGKSKGAAKKKAGRKHDLLSEKTDDLFLKELCFLKLENSIKAYRQTLQTEKEKKLNSAREKGLLLMCNICCEEEVLPEDMRPCDAEMSHLFCKDCVRRHTESQIGVASVIFKCLDADCESEFSVDVLKTVLKASVFNNLIKRKQKHEIKAAGISDLENCPYCDFATVISNKEEKIFLCQNPDCLKKSCRFCKNMSHLPLSCEEAKDKKKTDTRTYLENEMSEAVVRECYSCRNRFIKEDGCNKMRCACGAIMCYLCKKQLRDSYDHFYDNGLLRRMGNSSKTKCPLWSNSLELHAEEAKKRALEVKKNIDPSAIAEKDDPTKNLPEVPKVVGQPGRPARRMFHEQFYHRGIFGFQPNNIIGAVPPPLIIPRGNDLVPAPAHRHALWGEFDNNMVMGNMIHPVFNHPPVPPPYPVYHFPNDGNQLMVRRDQFPPPPVRMRVEPIRYGLDAARRDPLGLGEDHVLADPVQIGDGPAQIGRELRNGPVAPHPYSLDPREMQQQHAYERRVCLEHRELMMVRRQMGMPPCPHPLNHAGNGVEAPNIQEPFGLHQDRPNRQRDMVLRARHGARRRAEEEDHYHNEMKYMDRAQKRMEEHEKRLGIVRHKMSPFVRFEREHTPPLHSPPQEDIFGRNYGPSQRNAVPIDLSNSNVNGAGSNVAKIRNPQTSDLTTPPPLGMGDAEVMDQAGPSHPRLPPSEPQPGTAEGTRGDQDRKHIRRPREMLNQKKKSDTSIFFDMFRRPRTPPLDYLGFPIDPNDLSDSE